jgi:hypothetical protein
MTTEQYVNKLRNSIKLLEKDNKPLQMAAFATHETMIDRIFVEGKATDNGQIGKYNTTNAIYINPKNAVKKGGLKVAGKYGETTFKNGKKHKTAYVKSYSDYRGKVGRQNSYVDLVLSGDLNKDYANKGQPIKINNNTFASAVSRDINLKKIDGQEVHFSKKIFSLTKSERDLFQEIAQKELMLILE